ncbi:MAG: hydantoinase B/oxoprolinase family protein, partial [Myxococcales bacterium]|nr:hydantoinase B/oxoprolinase family protein [Myxococcales bacterium]
EARFPVRLLRFGLRRGSGGAGRHRGGDGLVRRLEMLAPLRVSLLSDRRVVPPFGLAGGHPGAPGSGTHGDRPLPARTTIDTQPGDVVTIETPGGGGWGDPQQGRPERTTDRRLASHFPLEEP